MSAPPMDAVMCAPKNPEPTEDSPSSAQPIYRSNTERMPEEKRGDRKQETMRTQFHAPFSYPGLLAMDGNRYTVLLYK